MIIICTWTWINICAESGVSEEEGCVIHFQRHLVSTLQRQTIRIHWWIYWRPWDICKNVALIHKIAWSVTMLQFVLEEISRHLRCTFWSYARRKLRHCSNVSSLGNKRSLEEVTVDLSNLKTASNSTKKQDSSQAKSTGHANGNKRAKVQSLAPFVQESSVLSSVPFPLHLTISFPLFPGRAILQCPYYYAQSYFKLLYQDACDAMKVIVWWVCRGQMYSRALV